MSPQIVFEDSEASSPSRLKRWVGGCLIALMVALLILGGGAYWAWQFYNKTLTSPVGLDDTPISFEIRSGQSVKSITNRLQDKGLIADAWVFRFAAKVQDKDTSMAVGDYELNATMTMQQILDAIQFGQLSEQTVWIQDGWRLEEVAAYLEREGIATAEEFMAVARDANYDYPFLSAVPPISKPATATLEGFIHPDRYQLPANPTLEDFMVRVLNNFNRKYEEYVVGNLNNRSLYEVLTMASIVQREARGLEEMRMVAGVFWNRVDNNMRLDADPTVLYALGSWQARLDASALQVDSPYNTRRYAGLPPGPIANPNINAIRASLEPTDHDYLFFLTDREGRMRYARTNAEHNENKRVYGVSGL